MSENGTSPNGTHPKIGGFVPKPRTIDVVCDWIEPDEGAEPLTAKIAVNLNFAQIDYMRETLTRINDGVTYLDLFEMVVPQVVAWNAKRFDPMSGAYIDIPPPAEIGADALRLVDQSITLWLATEIAQSQRGDKDDRGNGLTPSGDTPGTSDGDSTTSKPPTGTTTGTKTTRSRKDSRKR